MEHGKLETSVTSPVSSAHAYQTTEFIIIIIIIIIISLKFVVLGQLRHTA